MSNKGLCIAVLLILATLGGCKQEEPSKARPLQTTVWKLAQLDLGNTPHELTDIPQLSNVGFVIFNAEDQSLKGFAGCQQVEGRYRVDGEQLHIDSIILSGSRCHKARFDEVGERFANALRSVTTYRLGTDDARLELQTDGNTTAVLLYRTPKEFFW
jgi:heat shock protein HslJ